MTSSVAKLAATLAFAGVAASSLAGVASAADLNAGSIKDRYRPVSAAPALPVWQGLYAGANLGYGWSKVTDGGNPFAVDGHGIAGGLHAGYNHQIRTVVLGIEGDFSWADVNGRETVLGFGAIDTQHRWYSSVRGRLGMALDRTLIYATAGYGWSNVRIQADDGATFASQTRTDGGLVWGGGVEYKINPNLSLRAEALRFETSGKWRTDDGSTVKLETPTTEVRAGVTWHINTWR